MKNDQTKQFYIINSFILRYTYNELVVTQNKYRIGWFKKKKWNKTNTYIFEKKIMQSYSRLHFF